MAALAMERDTETFRPDGDKDDTGRREAATPLRPGDTLGHFVIIDAIGFGGMGEVYAARDVELDRKVAIKVLRHGTFGSEERRARLRREAQALAKIVHPNVVTVHEVAEDKGHVYIAMEFVEGETLAAWLAEARPWRDILSRFVQAGRGLLAAHHQGLIHRDFKPENVFVGSDGRVRVGDFGLVGMEGGSPSNPSISPSGPPAASGTPSQLTDPGRTMGTPRYMAPEQHVGGTIDARTDEFAFAVALYCALYRRPPFGGKTLAEVRQNVLDQRLQPIPRGSGVPRWLERIVLRGLNREPDARFPGMDAFLGALERGSRRRARWMIVGAAAALAAGAGAWALLRTDPCGGSAAMFAGAWDDGVKAAVTKAFVASGRTYAADVARRVGGALDGYAATWAVARTDACRATAVRREQSAEVLDARMACFDQRLEGVRQLTRLLAAADGPTVDRSISAALGLDPIDGCSAANIARRPRRGAPTPETRAVAQRLAEVSALLRLGRLKAAQELSPKLVDQARVVGDKPLLAEALLLHGRVIQEKDSVAAVKALEEAASLGTAIEDDDVTAVALYRMLETVSKIQRRRTDAATLRPAVEAAVRRSKDERLLVAFEHLVAAQYLEDGQSDKALAAVEQAAALADRVLGPDTLEQARILGERSRILRSLGRLDDAVAASTRGLAIAEKLLGPDHIDLSIWLNALGGHEIYRRKFDAAKGYFERALRVAENGEGPDSLKAAGALNNLGLVAENQGRYEDAIAYYQRSLPIMEKRLGPEHRDIALLLSNMANLLRRQRRLDESLALNRRVLSLREKLLPPAHPEIGVSAYSLGEGLVYAGKPKEGIPWLQRAQAIFEQAYPPGHPDRVRLVTTLARAYIDDGRPADAFPLLEQAERALGEHPDALALALVRFQTARALRAAHREPERAIALAKQARASVSAGDQEGDELVEEVDRFLK